MAERLGGDRRVTVGADKAYDNASLVEQLRRVKITSHIHRTTKHRAARRSTRERPASRDMK